MGGGAGRGLDFGATWGSGRLPLAEIGIEALLKEIPHKTLGEEEPVGRGALIDEALVAELERDKVKFNRSDMVLITRDKTGQTVWLEKGNNDVGLTHLKRKGHIKDLSERFGVSEEGVPELIRNIIRDGTVISNKMVKRHGRDGYERKYEYQGKSVVLAAVGTNGFLVSIYPI